MTSMPIPLEAGYTAEFDSVDRSEWYKIINQFSDANIYQTWDYDAVRCGEGNISHFILRFSDKIVSVGQARIVKTPLLGLGVAYIRWGPLWQLGNQNTDPFVFRMAIRALRNEYVCRRRMILRIYPFLYNINSSSFRELLIQEGYNPTPGKDPQRTLLLDLQQPLDEIRKNFKQKWRNGLNRAEKNKLEIVEGTEDYLFEYFIMIYRELLKRKQFKEPSDINEFRLIQRDLPFRFEMGIFLCNSSEIYSAGAIFSCIGDTGVYLFGATNDQGMKDKASYLLQWRAIQWMKDNGCRYYNLNGVNPMVNPGGYHFKSGVAGKTGKDVHYLGSFDCYSGILNATLARGGDWVFPFIKKGFSYFRSKS